MLISIIIPVYNVEKYLKRCVDSIINQTYKNIEIILVDDGSTDKSGMICDEYERMDSRVKSIHIKNGGASKARNIGLDIAKGEYISFIDSDDWILPNFIEKLLGLCVENDAQIAKCKVIDVNKEENLEIKKLDSNKEIYSSMEIINKIYTDRNLFNVAIMNKLYRKDVFYNLRFQEGIINEDEEILCKIIKNAKNIVVTDEVLYCYFLSPGSVTRSRFRKQNLDILKALESRLKQLEQPEYKEVCLQTQADYIKIIGNLYYCVSVSNWSDKRRYLIELRDKINILKKEIKYNKYFTIKDKLKLLLCFKFKFILKLFYLIRGN